MPQAAFCLHLPNPSQWPLLPLWSLWYPEPFLVPSSLRCPANTDTLRLGGQGCGWSGCTHLKVGHGGCCPCPRLAAPQCICKQLAWGMSLTHLPSETKSVQAWRLQPLRGHLSIVGWGNVCAYGKRRLPFPSWRGRGASRQQLAGSRPFNRWAVCAESWRVSGAWEEWRISVHIPFWADGVQCTIGVFLLWEDLGLDWEMGRWNSCRDF